MLTTGGKPGTDTLLVISLHWLPSECERKNLQTKGRSNLEWCGTYWG